MFRICSLAAVVLVAAITPEAVRPQASKGKHAAPKVALKEDGTKNGWEIRLKYRSSDKYARAGQAWTLEAAQEVVENIKKQAPSLDEKLQPAEILVIGKDGDGKVKEGDGPALPDWPEIEARLLSTVEGSDELSAQLKKAGEAYEAAQQEIEKAMQARKALSADEVTAINKLVDTYNGQVGDIRKKFFKDGPVALPTFRPVTPETPRQVDDWPEARKEQYEIEQFASQHNANVKAQELRREKLLEATKRLVIDENAGKDKSFLAAQKRAIDKAVGRYKEARKDLDKEGDMIDGARDANRSRLNAARNNVLDSREVLPSAKIVLPGEATYLSLPGAKVVKPDAPLDKQPKGYPRPYDRTKKLGDGEKVVVDPVLRIGTNVADAPVLAGVPGKVVKVNPATESVEVEVDPFGTKVVYSGVDPSGVKEGDYIGPKQAIGKLSSSGRKQGLRIRGINRQGRYVDPSSLLSRTGEPAELLPTKQKAKPEDLEGGKGKGRETLIFDESAPKRKPGELSKYQVDFKEAVTKTRLERLKKQADQAVDELAAARQKKKEAEGDLDKAKNALDRINTQAEKLLQQAKDYKKERDDIQKEADRLEKEKVVLDQDAAKLKGSKDKKAIEAYNERARRYNKALQDLKGRKSKLEASDPTSKIADLRSGRDTAQRDKARLEGALPGLGSKVDAAQSKVDAAKGEVAKAEKELKDLAAQKEKFKADDKSDK
jgi:hypothetical protein